MAEEKRVSAAGDDSGTPARNADGGAVTRNVSGRGLQPDEAAPGPFVLYLRECIPADEVALAKLDSPAEARLIWVDRLVHVISIKAQRGFEAGRIARA